MESRGPEANFIFTLARSAAQNISEGYYKVPPKDPRKKQVPHVSLKRSISRTRLMPLIAEIKFASPAEGKLRPVGDVRKIARAYEQGGVSGISVLTEPKHFEGDINYLPLVKESVSVPVLMKDIIIDPLQIDAGADMGADAVLFIAGIFMNKLSRASLEEMFSKARSRGVEVLFETHTENEFLFALETEADIIGINNRSLENLEVSLETSKRLLARAREDRETLHMMGKDKLVISESGISTMREMEELSELGADGFLIGSTLMKSADIDKTVRSLTGKRGR